MRYAGVLRVPTRFNLNFTAMTKIPFKRPFATITREKGREFTKPTKECKTSFTLFLVYSFDGSTMRKASGSTVIFPGNSPMVSPSS